MAIKECEKGECGEVVENLNDFHKKMKLEVFNEN